jgi:hypothetical protein|tara:strand:+ start:88 stop:318 length:231 start_codon:yes stop_codon:yes gene_type:complete
MWKHLSASEQEAKLLEELGASKMSGKPRGCIIKNLHLDSDQRKMLEDETAKRSKLLGYKLTREMVAAKIMEEALSK